MTNRTSTQDFDRLDAHLEDLYYIQDTLDGENAGIQDYVEEVRSFLYRRIRELERIKWQI
jgi:hypothetical protein